MSSQRVLDSGTAVGAFASLLHEAASSPHLSAHERRKRGTGSALDALREEAKVDGFELGRMQGLAVGRTEGFDAAKAEGLEQQRELVAQFTEDLARIDELVSEGMARWCVMAEAEVEGLVTSIARKVLHQELAQSRDSVLAIVKAALSEVTLSKSAQIRVNPFDRLTLQSAKPDLLTCCSSLRSIEIVEDSSILGGCAIVTDGGDVEATIDGQIDRLEAA